MTIAKDARGLVWFVSVGLILRRQPDRMRTVQGG